MPNGDRRTYGDDGYPAKDYDHSDHGFPDKHPHDENGGHYHDWDWSDSLNPQRSDPYVITWDPSSTTWASLGALILIAVDDFTGVGVADDFAIPVILAALFADGI